MPSSPEVSRARYLRKNAEAGKRCPKCGVPIAHSSTMCYQHANELKPSYRRLRSDGWTRETAIAALQAWAAAHGGDPPPAAIRTRDSKPRVPSKNVVKRLFGSWRAGVAAAGLIPVERGGQRATAGRNPRHGRRMPNRQMVTGRSNGGTVIPRGVP